MSIISLVNYKGGVGKTVITANLAYELSRRNYNVLMLDLDPQMDLSKIYLPQKAKTHGILELLTHKRNIADVCLEVEENLHIIPGSRNLARFEAKIKLLELKKILNDPTLPEFDFIVIDHPPANSKTSLMGLAAADYVIIVTDVEAFSMANLNNLLTDLEQIKQDINPNLNILGILPNKIDRRRSLTKSNLQELYKNLPDITFENSISNDTAFPISLKQNTPLRKLKWHSKPLSQINKVIDEFL